MKLPKETGDTVIALHVGMQRLDNPYQYETIPSPTPFGLGATNVVHLDRPRTVETLKITHLFRNSGERRLFPSDREGLKAILYGGVPTSNFGGRTKGHDDEYRQGAPERQRVPHRWKS